MQSFAPLSVELRRHLRRACGVSIKIHSKQQPIRSNDPGSGGVIVFLRVSILVVIISLLLCHVNLCGQRPASSSPPAAPPSASAPAPTVDRIQQMRADLNQMESLMNNMSSEITFLRDQNLQILLNTNVRMWTILIRDLRRQLDDEEQKRALDSKPAKPPAPKP